MKRTGILVVNLGTPDSYKSSDVARYLREFLMDGRVIDIPYWKRWLLVNGIIVPFRAPKVAREYKKLWMEGSSPLLHYGRNLSAKLQQKLGLGYQVELAMRYQNPSIGSALNKLQKAGVSEIIVLPLFPQYASATTGSVAEKVMDEVKKWQAIPSIRFINSYHQHPAFIESFAANGAPHLAEESYDHVLFSYHGIPERHLDKLALESKSCDRHNCSCAAGKAENPYCYRSACFETTALIAERLGLKAGQYTTSFQSRLGKDPWIQPYTDAVVEALARKGVKKLLVLSPSFVADCLETTLEIGEQYHELFLENGGEAFRMVESLNDHDHWVEALIQILQDSTPAQQQQAISSIA